MLQMKDIQDQLGPGGQRRPGGGMAMGQMRRYATVKSFIEEKYFRNVFNNGVAPHREFADWSNKMQEIAEATRLGIPIRRMRRLNLVMVYLTVSNTGLTMFSF